MQQKTSLDGTIKRLEGKTDELEAKLEKFHERELVNLRNISQKPITNKDEERP